MALLFMIAVTLCLLMVYLFYSAAPAIKRFLDLWKASKAISHLPRPIEQVHWLLGNNPYYPGPNEDGLMLNIKFVERFPKLYIFYYSGVYPVVTVHHPDTVKQILKSGAPKAKLFPGIYYFGIPWIGDGLLLSSGEKWSRNRKLLTPAFHFDILKPYMTIYNQATEKLLQRFEHGARHAQSVEVFHETSLCTLDIILKCAFSYAGDVQSDVQGSVHTGHEGESSPYIDAVMSITHLIAKRVFSPHHYLDFIYHKTSNGKKFKKACELSHEVAEDVIKSRRQVLLEVGREKFLSSHKYIDFLDVLLLACDEDGQGLTDREIRDEVETFMFEGHDTTKSAISFLLYNLARHPEYQARAAREVDAVMEGRKSHDILWNDLSKLPYLTQCIKESLRLYTTVPIIARILDKPLQVDGYTLPINTPIDIFLWNLHHNPTVWGEDHMTYDPERFSDENMALMDPFAFVPFSAGGRNCIGQNFAMNEIKVTVGRIIHKFILRVNDKIKFEIKPEAVLKPVHGIHLYFKKRETEDADRA